MNSPAGKLLHVLGAGPWQVPTIERARQLGVRVLVSDAHEQRPGYVLADLHVVADITDVDRTLEVARRQAIDGILCDTTDTGVRAAAAVAEALGLAGIGMPAARACTDKSMLRARCVSEGLPTPRFVEVGDRAAWHAAVAEIGFPLVVKPVDNQSGRGVLIVDTPCAAEAAFEAAMLHSRTQRLLCESRLRGPEYIVDGFVDGETVHVLGIASKRPYADNPTICSRILYHSGEEFERLRRLLMPQHLRVLRSVGLTRGVFHVEYIVDGRLGPTVIDLAARGGGVMIYSRVLPHVSGVDAIEASILLALGLPAHTAATRRRAACIEFFRLPEGIFGELLGVEQALGEPGIAAVHLSRAPGDQVGVLRHKDDRPGFVVALADGESEALAAASRAVGHLRVQMAGAQAAQPVRGQA